MHLIFSSLCSLPRLLLWGTLFLTASVASAAFERDIVVYGGTSGGVTAAVQAARMGKTVVLVSPTEHLGGMTASGLGWTDLGRSSILGGLSREFYHRVYRHYTDNDDGWIWQTRSDFGNRGQGGGAFDPELEIASVFEPSVAEAIFMELLAEHDVTVETGRLDLESGVVMDGNRIVALRMEDGREFRGNMFIDASYEGDLLPGAGVTFTTGRESNAVYDETISGIQVAKATKNQLPDGIDPYVVPGVPRSGLLPGVNPDAGGPDGSGDHRLQAFCYRMVLTDVPENRVMIPQPEGYDEADYELLFRAIEAGQNSRFFKFDLMPNRKTDSNNASGISTDLIGGNYGPDWNWATLDHEGREAVAKKHENWQRGLVWTLQNHPRVPESIRDDYDDWGLPLDEFTDNGHWPYQLYIREARRMVSDYVMTQHHCLGRIVPADSVGMAAYTMDSHNTQRHVRDGMVKNEGDLQDWVPNPYPISYRSIIPGKGECENLLVPWSLSASHMAFGSIRMEPVFMALGQSAATAAALAIDHGVSVQELSYEKLAMVLRADGQVLYLGGSNSPEIGEGTPVDSEDPASGASLEGEWLSSTSVAGFSGTNYLHDDNRGKGTKSVRFIPDLPEAGFYDVYLIWTAHFNRASNVPVTIEHRDGSFSTTVNQRENGGTWQRLGAFAFEAGTGGSLLVETTGTNGYVTADAAVWVPVTTTAEVATAVSTIVRGGSQPGIVVFARTGSIDEPLEVRYELTGDEADLGLLSLSGVFTIPAGESDAKLRVEVEQGEIPRGMNPVTLRIVDGDGYEVGDLATAVLHLRDEPFDAWRADHFSPEELSGGTMSDERADADGDGLVNLLEFFGGGDPREAEALPVFQVKADGERMRVEITRHALAAELPFSLERSDDLVSWLPMTEELREAERSISGEFETTTVSVDQEEVAEEAKLFFRLRVQNPEEAT